MFKNTLFISFLAFFLVVGIASAQNENIKKGKEMSQAHRSAIAGVVEDLRETAGKDNNIGEELREIAQEQEQSNDRATEAMEAVETRGKFKTFLIGTDYKNIGAIRSELVTTDNHIDRLTKAKERTDDPVVQAELDAEIATLQETQTSAEAFVSENEDKFSLFGWLVKLFN